MKQKCTPPYENCLHGHFYRAALDAGIDEKKAVKLTEQLKKLHTIEWYKELESDIPKIVEGIKKVIAHFPEKVRDEAVRVLYAVLDYADSLINSYQNRRHIEEELSAFFLRDLRKAIREAFYEPLQGETIIYTYEKWLNGDYDKTPYTQEDYVLNYRKFIKSLLPDEEYQKILAAKKEAAERYIHYHLEACKKHLATRLEGAREPLALLQKELTKIIELLENKEKGQFTILYDNGHRRSFIAAKFNSTSDKGYYNEIAYWYEKVIVDNVQWIEACIDPKHITGDLPVMEKILPAFAVVFYEYKNYLEGLLAELQSKNPAKPNGEKQIPNQSPSYHPDLPGILKTAFQQLQLLDTTGQFIGRKRQIKPLFDVLVAKGWFKSNPSKTKRSNDFAALMLSKFEFSITGKTIMTGERDNDQEEYFKEFNRIVKSNQRK